MPDPRTNPEDELPELPIAGEIVHCFFGNPSRPRTKADDWEDRLLMGELLEEEGAADGP